MNAAEEFAPAKVNLALHLRRRRADGYHDLDSWFAFADFGDRLVARPAEDWTLTIDGPQAPAVPVAGNLVLRAARAFAEASGDRTRHAFALRKEIPVAAGLGGGSADAAATLRLLNRLSRRPLPTARLQQLAAGLGADVPACLSGTSLIGRGTGTELQPAPPVTGTRLLLVNPGVALSTAEVFAGWQGADGGAIGADWRTARNDLQAAAIALQPKVAEVLGWLQELPGARYTRMSGSGASCFAVFDGPVPDMQPPAGWWARVVQLL